MLLLSFLASLLFTSLTVAVNDGDVGTLQLIGDLNLKIVKLEQRLRVVKSTNEQLTRSISSSAKDLQRCRNYLDEHYVTIADLPDLRDRIDLLDALGDTINQITPLYKDLPSAKACTPKPYIESAGSGVVLTASSMWDKWHGPQKSPLNYNGSPPQAWSSASPKVDKAPWIQVDLGEVKGVSAIAIRGRGKYRQHVTWYTLSYSSDGIKWITNDTWIRGNKWKYPGYLDQDEISLHRLSDPIQARYVRVHPVKWHWHPSLRWEVYGTDCSEHSEIGYIASRNGDGLMATGNVPKMNPRFAVLDSSLAWTASKSNDKMTIDFGYPRPVNAIATQGSPVQEDWIYEYKLWHGNTTSALVAYNNGTLLNANDNQNLVVIQPLQQFTARYVQLQPVTYKNQPALRLELYGPPAPLKTQDCLW